MSYTSQDWRIAITNLLKRTSLGEVVWRPSELFKGDAWHEVDQSFECEINDKIYVISAIRWRHYVDEDEYYWANGFDFSIYGKSFEPSKLASAPPDLSILRSLLDAAENSFAFRSNALGDLL